MFKISYTQQKSNLLDVIKHFEYLSNENLDYLEIVNIEEYSNRIFNNTILFEAWFSNELIGLIAAYFNSEENFVFITNVSVLPEYRNNLVGEQLLKNVIHAAKESNIELIRLEVYDENKKVIEFYEKHGFYRKRFEKNKWEMWLEIDQNLPLVSISCITYNHEEFIETTVESFISQEVDFRYEILIHDDASTDKTQEVIKRLEKKYPTIINPIYQSENQYTKSKIISAKFNYPRARGKYIAVCEGDDIWIDKLKLSKQVTFLEKNSDVNLCFTNANLIGDYDWNGKLIQKEYPQKFNIEYYLSHYGPMPTCTWMFKKSAVDFEKIPAFLSESMIGDFVWRFLIVNDGKFGYLNIITAQYRKHSGGVMTANQKVILIKNQKYTLQQLKNHFKGKYTFHFNKNDYYSRLAIEYLKESKYLNWIVYFVCSVFSTFSLHKTIQVMKSSVRIITSKK